MSPTPTNNLLLLFLSHLLLLKADSSCQQSFSCNNFSFQFPFTDINYPQCGLFPINCTLTEQKKNPRVYLGREFPYDLLEKVSADKFLILDTVLQNYLKEKSCFSFTNVSLPKSPSISFSYSPNITVFTCYNPDDETQLHFSQYKNTTCDILKLYYKIPPIYFKETDHELLPGCTMNQLPLNFDPYYSGDLYNLLSPQFTLEWNVSEACYQCYHQGGRCLTNSKNAFYCQLGNAIYRKLHNFSRLES